MKPISLLLHKQSLVFAILFILLFVQQPAWAAGPPVPSEMNNPMAQLLVGIIIALLLIIVLLAYVVLGAAELYLERYQETKKAAKLLLVAGMILGAAPLYAEQAAGNSEAVVKLSDTSLYTLIAVILVELGTIFYLLINLRALLTKEKAIAPSAKSSFSFLAWWEKVNRFKPVQEESNIDLGHDYDGIRELDNRLPPWWLYGFYACIIFAVIYLYRFHVAHTAPLSVEEYQLAVTEAAADKEAYLAKAANKVDEKTVVYQTSPDYLAGGQQLFSTACSPCHLADGGGSVGPNLTDDYWIHGNTIQDIFKTIKYGYPEKGMKSWQEDYTPAQMAQMSSYVKSLQGTQPAKPKEPQGILVVAAGNSPSDSSRPAANSDSATAKPSVQ
jgi:cytochrome c oxidase cbb3-type subunit 3